MGIFFSILPLTAGVSAEPGGFPRGFLSDFVDPPFFVVVWGLGLYFRCHVGIGILLAGRATVDRFDELAMNEVLRVTVCTLNPRDGDLVVRAGEGMSS